MNPPSVFHPARVARVEAISDELFELDLEVASEVAHSFTLPGQFHFLRGAGEAARPFAIASAPGNPRFEYLVRKGSALANALSRPGLATVETSLAEGVGFPVFDARGKDLLLIATGTGAAPIRSVLETVARSRGDFGQVTYLLGGRNPRDFGWPEEWPRWREMNVSLVPIVLASEPGWSGMTGHLKDHLPKGDLSHTRAFLVGAPEMVEAVRAALRIQGMPDAQMHLNH